MKKLTSILLIIVIILNINIKVFADDLEEENINEKEIQEEVLNVSTNVENIPQTNSRAVLILDRASKQVLYEKNGYEKRAMASTTKIMTAIVVLENANLTDTVEVSKKAGWTGGSRLGLKEKDKITVNDLLYGLMLRSGNDAAVALAEYVGGNIDGFAKLMNKKAKELKLKNTHFVTPHGLDQDEHYTTAYELALITDYALKNQKFANIVNTKTYNININGNSKSISNTNELLGNLYGVDGVKTGFTNNAGRCLVTSTTREGNQIICVVLGADTKKIRTSDSAKLIKYAFSNFEYINIKEQIEDEFKNWKKTIGNIEIIKGVSKITKVKMEELEYEKLPVNKENIKDIEITIENEEVLNAPILENQIIGKIAVKIKDKEIINKNIMIAEEIKKKKILDYFNQIFFNYNKYLNYNL